MGRVRQRLLATARGRPTVLLEGDTGTGKSLLARHVVHAATGRRGPFVSLDLATVPPDLMAARLFGVVRGAYTGATMDRPGAFEHAQGGTLFLDEIGNLTSEAQRLLLSVLQERRVTRLGCLREREVDVKVIAATNEDLLELVKRGVFRRDLLMRLNPSGRLRIPSLRERRGDLQGAVEHMLAVLTQDQELGTELEAYRRENSISSRSLGLAIGDRPPAEQDRLQVWFPHASWSRMHNHDWPGNLRELKSVLENVLWNILVGCAELAGVRRPDVLTVHPWQVVELLGDDEVSADSADEMGVCVQPQATLNGVSVDLERQVYRKLYIRSGGAFGEMALQLLGDAALGRKVQLRFNQLGLRVRDLKGLLH
jgi:DNA-binding NtrC family response regulator